MKKQIQLFRYSSNVWALFGDEGEWLEENERTDQKVILHTFNVLRETEKSYFIRDPKTGKEKRISKTAVATYAYDTRSKALNNYKHRCSSNYGHCSRNLDVAKAFFENSRNLTVENAEQNN